MVVKFKLDIEDGRGRWLRDVGFVSNWNVMIEIKYMCCEGFVVRRKDIINFLLFGESDVIRKWFVDFVDRSLI